MHAYACKLLLSSIIRCSCFTWCSDNVQVLVLLTQNKMKGWIIFDCSDLLSSSLTFECRAVVEVNGESSLMAASATSSFSTVDLLGNTRSPCRRKTKWERLLHLVSWLWILNQTSVRIWSTLPQVETLSDKHKRSCRSRCCFIVSFCFRKSFQTLSWPQKGWAYSRAYPSFREAKGQGFGSAQIGEKWVFSLTNTEKLVYYSQRVLLESPPHALFVLARVPSNNHEILTECLVMHLHRAKFPKCRR